MIRSSSIMNYITFHFSFFDQIPLRLRVVVMASTSLGHVKAVPMEKHSLNSHPVRMLPRQRKNTTSTLGGGTLKVGTP